MTWIPLLALAFLFYAKSVGMAWYATIMIFFAIIAYFLDGIFEDF